MPISHARNLLEWLRQYGASSPVVGPLADQLQPVVVVDNVLALRRPIHGSVMVMDGTRAGVAGAHSGIYLSGRAGGIWLRQVFSQFNTTFYVAQRQSDITASKTSLSTANRFVSLPDGSRPPMQSDAGVCTIPAASIASSDAEVSIQPAAPLRERIFVPPGSWLYIVHNTAATGAFLAAVIEEVPVT